LSGLFYNLGRKVGPKVRKAKWMWESATGSEADAIKVEHEVGRDLSREIRHQLGPGREPQTEQILSEIGNRLVACVANKSRIFSFETVEGAEPNAFALPGGFIFVTKSLVHRQQLGNCRRIAGGANSRAPLRLVAEGWSAVS
jgi:hypothetical protein